MTVELGEFPSASTPGKSYTVKRGNDDVIYCDCWAWKKNRTCSHKKAIERQLNTEVVSSGTGNVIVEPQRKLTIQEAINRAVAEMRGNR